MVEIRELTPEDDLADLIALSRAFFAEYEAHHPIFSVGSLQDGDIVAFFSRSIEAQDGATFVAIADDRMVGYLTVGVHRQPSFHAVREVGAISGLMVSERYRRRGIARQLLERAVALFSAQGLTYYTVYTAVANDAAVSLYTCLGLRPLHVNMVGTVPPVARGGEL